MSVQNYFSLLFLLIFDHYFHLYSFVAITMNYSLLYFVFQISLKIHFYFKNYFHFLRYHEDRQHGEASSMIFAFKLDLFRFLQNHSLVLAKYPFDHLFFLLKYLVKTYHFSDILDMHYCKDFCLNFTIHFNHNFKIMTFKA